MIMMEKIPPNLSKRLLVTCYAASTQSLPLLHVHMHSTGCCYAHTMNAIISDPFSLTMINDY